MIRLSRDIYRYFQPTDPEAPFDRGESISLLLIQND
jgi:hypothetical protein